MLILNKYICCAATEKTIVKNTLKMCKSLSIEFPCSFFRAWRHRHTHKCLLLAAVYSDAGPCRPVYIISPALSLVKLEKRRFVNGNESAGRFVLVFWGFTVKEFSSVRFNSKETLRNFFSFIFRFLAKFQFKGKAETNFAMCVRT